MPNANAVDMQLLKLIQLKLVSWAMMTRRLNMRPRLVNEALTGDRRGSKTRFLRKVHGLVSDHCGWEVTVIHGWDRPPIDMDITDDWYATQTSVGEQVAQDCFEKGLHRITTTGAGWENTQDCWEQR